MRWFLIPVTVLIIALGPLSVRAEAVSNGTTYFDYGIFCALETVEQREAKDTISGVVNLLAEAPVFLRKTAVVPAKIGIGFGIHVDIAEPLNGPVIMQTVHPPMGENGVTTERWTTEITPGRLNYNGFTFEYDYELLPGPWTITAFANGRELYKVDFTVVDPALTPPISCEGSFVS